LLTLVFFLSAAVSSPARAGLAWPIACALGRDCNVTNFPDPKKTGTTALCQKNFIVGHEGTDIAISQEDMDRGMEVFAADDGVVLWVFDGKYDRCPDPAQPDCAEPPAMKPGGHDGTTVCTPLGPFCREGPSSGQCFWCFAGGNVVVIRHPHGEVFATRYDHFKKGSITVKPGHKVKKGDVIGLVGSAGHSTAPHLHFEVWGKTFYDPVDPWAGKCSPKGHKSLWDEQPDL
jgi:murein DD-endopeptidase MepM/ murein hydrolase activator NlpD